MRSFLYSLIVLVTFSAGGYVSNLSAQSVHREYIVIRNSGDAVNDVARATNTLVGTTSFDVTGSTIVVANYTEIKVQNTDSANAVNCGFTNLVTTASGWRIAAGASQTFAVSSAIPVWCIAGATVDLRILSFK